MVRADAIKEVKNIFSGYKKLQPTDKLILKALNDGKLYELYVLSLVVEDLANRGFTLVFKGKSLQFKGGHGKIKKADPHFEITAPQSNTPSRYLFVDIEFETFGSTQISVTDKSLRHEVDIVVVDIDQGYPTHANIDLGVECKAVANFMKSILKEVLGVRRELSLLTAQAPSSLSVLGGAPPVYVPANPASEYWLSYIDPAGDSYQESPQAFGVQFKHMPI